MGLIDLKTFLTSQQATWIFRAKNAPRDNWQYDLLTLSHNNILNVAVTNIDKRLNPILYGLVVSYNTVKTAHDSCGNNFLRAPLLNNTMFRRGPRDVRILDYDFFLELCHNVSLCNLSSRCFIDFFIGNRVKTVGAIETLLGVEINHDVYILLRNALNYFKSSHRKQLALSTEPVDICYYSKIKKPSKTLRILLDSVKPQKN